MVEDNMKVFCRIVQSMYEKMYKHGWSIRAHIDGGRLYATITTRYTITTRKAAIFDRQILVENSYFRPYLVENNYFRPEKVGRI